MKAELNEYEGCFSIDLIAETKEEIARIVKFGLNATKEIRYKSVWISGNEFMGSVVLGKKTRTTVDIKG